MESLVNKRYNYVRKWLRSVWW